MQRFAELVSSNAVVQAIISIAAGLLLAIWPETTILTIVYIFAAGLALSGIASIVSYARQRKTGISSDGVLILGLFLLVIALVVLIFPEAFASLFSLFLGIILVISGVVNAVRSASLRKSGGGSWLVMLIVSVLIAIGGVVIIVNPFETTTVFVLVLGFLLLAKGIIDLIVQFVWGRSSGS